MVRANSSSSTPTASEKRTPCLRKLAFALAGSHSYPTPLLYVQMYISVKVGPTIVAKHARALEKLWNAEILQSNHNNWVGAPEWLKISASGGLQPDSKDFYSRLVQHLSVTN